MMTYLLSLKRDRKDDLHFSEMMYYHRIGSGFFTYDTIEK